VRLRTTIGRREQDGRPPRRSAAAAFNPPVAAMTGRSSTASTSSLAAVASSSTPRLTKSSPPTPCHEFDSAEVHECVRICRVQPRRAREWDVAIETAGLGVCTCGHPSGGGHDGGCQTSGCGCRKYVRAKASPVTYVLRHTFASNALAAGVGTFELARYMGSSVEMIERTYGHLVAGADDVFRTRLDAFAAARDGVEVASSVEGESR
jgi:hypothetical protein